MKIIRFTFLVTALLITIFVSMFIECEAVSPVMNGAVEGWVSHITMNYLYIDGNHYPISRDVNVVLNTEEGREITLKTIVSVGHIQRARLHIERGSVVKIVILEVEQ